MNSHAHIHVPTRRGILTAVGAGLTLSYLGGGLAHGQGAAASKKKLVVIICRGAMDGLSISPQIGDPAYAALRGVLAIRP